MADEVYVCVVTSVGGHRHLLVLHSGLQLGGSRADDGDLLLVERVGPQAAPVTVPEMSVDPLEIVYLVLTVITDVTVLHFSIELLVVSLGSHFVLGSVSTFC